MWPLMLGGEFGKDYAPLDKAKEATTMGLKGCFESCFQIAITAIGTADTVELVEPAALVEPSEHFMGETERTVDDLIQKKNMFMGFGQMGAVLEPLRKQEVAAGRLVEVVAGEVLGNFQKEIVTEAGARGF